jgi:hypothetical protein
MVAIDRNDLPADLPRPGAGPDPTVGLIHSESQRPIEFDGDRLADLFSAAADWLLKFEQWRGAAPDVLAVTTEICDDGGPTYRLILLCADTQFDDPAQRET